MKNRILALILVMLMVLAAAPMAAIAEASQYADLYEFEIYYNYDWWGIKPWGEDETSKYWSELFNINIIQNKPDADAAAKLNLMVSSGDLPDVIQMDRGADHQRIAQLGMFVDLEPLKANNPAFDENIALSTQELLKIDGVLYSIPHWVRKGATGGNELWMYNKNIYEAAGSPDLSTFEGLYEYAKLVKETVPENHDMPTIPFATQNNNDAFNMIPGAFYRSMGGVRDTSNYTARIDGKIQLKLRDPIYRQAVMEANKWYREGLISESQFTDVNDIMLEKFSTGRVGLIYYDFSQDDNNHFRQILNETYPGDDWVQLHNPVYPPSAGVEKTYPDHKETPGWNVLCITKNAKDPQRIFDFFTHMQTKQGSIEMMYGPQGDWWEELDENGNPILKKSEAEMTAEELERIGSWRWSFCSHSDNVDLTKFAVNAMQPEDKRDWVVTTQADVLSPIMYVTDEYVGLPNTIDPLSDLGIQRTLCDDQYKAELPRIMMAATAEEAEALYDALIKFHDDNGFQEVEAAYDARHQEIVGIQGFSAFDK